MARHQHLFPSGRREETPRILGPAGPAREGERERDEVVPLRCVHLGQGHRGHACGGGEGAQDVRRTMHPAATDGHVRLHMHKHKWHK